MQPEIRSLTDDNNLIPVTRLTALWALSESMLGGLLHAVHVPFRGMIISSAAVILICLIAHFSEKRGEILKATFIVLLIKAAISPHTPIAAYGSVFLQGFLGEMFFIKKRFFSFSAVSFGLVVGILTGLQRLITLTLIFGATFWDAINEFANYVIKEFLISSADANILNFSLFLMILYVAIHMIFGFAAGVFASKFPQKINSESSKDFIIPISKVITSSEIPAIKKKKRKLWLKKSSYLLFFIFATGLLLISYFNPQALNLNSKSILMMVVRSLIIMLIWFYFLAPLITTLIKKILHKRQNEYAGEVKNIINHFPFYKKAASEIWKASSNYKGVWRVNYFIVALIINVLTLKIPE